MDNSFVVGAGNMGTAIAQQLARNSGSRVCVWGRRPEIVTSILEKRENVEYFPGRKLSDRIEATTMLADADDFDLIFLSVPSHATRSIVRTLKPFLRDKVIISLAKGVEFPPFRRMSEVVVEEAGLAPATVVLSGPNFADEIFDGGFTGTTIASTNAAALTRIKIALGSENLAVQVTDDIVGVELSGVLKNAYSIAMGICDALGVGRNAYYFVFNQAFLEMKDIIARFGGRTETIFLCSGFGDLCLTAGSDRSRNRTIGLLYGKKIPQVNSGDDIVQEGKKTLVAIKEVCRSIDIECPVIDFAHSVVWQNKNPDLAFRHLWMQLQGSR